MMKCKKILSVLLAVCLLISVLPTASLAAAVDTTALHNCNVPDGYHLFADLPTAEDPVTTETLYMGNAFDGVFYGMNGTFSSGSTTTSADVAAQSTITIHYGGNDETYGDYYYLVFTQASGTAYAFAYASGNFSQNKIQDTGLPSGGWAAKHKMFYDAEEHLFYHRPSADMTVMKALKISASSFKFFTDTVAKVLGDDTYPVRMYEPCASDNVAGTNETHQWSGSCSCGRKYDYKERVNIVDPAGYHQFDLNNLPTAENTVTTANLYLGAAFEADGTFYGMSSTASSNAYPTATALAEQCKITIHYGGEDDTYGTYYYVEFTLPSGTSYALAYSGGYFSQNKLTDGLPSGGWAAKHKMFFEEDYQFFYHRPSADMTVMKGLKISAGSKKLFTETVENLKVVSADYSPARLFEACTSDNVAGTDDIHVWSGTCQACGYKFDYQEKVTPDSYHVVTGLPTAENPEITGLSLGGNLEVDGKTAFYGLNAVSALSGSTRYFTTATEAKEQCIITVRYAGSNPTFGDYYNVIFRIPGGDSYALAYAGGYFSQNKLTDGEPSDGWATKHDLFYDAEDQFFYCVIESDDGLVRKGLKLSTASQNIFTETVENLKTESDAYVPVRLYEPCVSDKVAGKGAAGRWSGTCTCGYKFDVTADPNLALPEAHHEPITLPTAENPEPVERLHFGTGLVVDGTAVFYGMNSSFDSDHAATTSTEANEQYTFRVIYGGNDATYGDYYYVIYDNLDGTEYAFAYAGGYLSQNKILENGEPIDGWAAKHRMFFDQDGQYFYHRPSADMTVMKGLKISTTSYNVFTETVANLNGDNEIYPIRPYVICTSDNVPGETDTHHWSGTCSCGYKFDYEENYVVQLVAPQEGTPYFWGVTQLDAEGEPTYFFAGAKLTSNFNTQADMLTSTPIYVDVVDGGYNLYFLKDEAKQYICLGKDAANSYKTYIDFTETAANATVYTWNATYNTFVTSVVKDAEGGTVDMVLGAYTSGSTAYTKLNPLTLASLAQEHYFASHLYVKHMAHEFGTWTMDMDGSGIMYRTCECGHVQTHKVSDDMPAYAGVSLSLNNSFAINFHVESASFAAEAYTNPYVVFEMLGQKTMVTEPSVKGGNYVFTFKNLAPDLMGETVTATLYATAADGSAFVLTTDYSVAEYCYTALAMDSTGNELKVLLVETLNFGAASQTYRESESALVNANLTDEQKALGYADGWRTFETCRDFGTGNETKDVRWYGATLAMSDSIKLRVYFTADDATGLSVKVVGETIGEYTLTDIGTKDGRYYVDFAELNPAKMSEVITLTVYRGEDAVSTTMTYSIESYAHTWVNKDGASDEQVALAKAVIRYGDAAAEYAALQGHTVNETVELATGVTKYNITYHVSGTSTQAYAVVVNADAEAEVMTVAASWDASNSVSKPVNLKNAYAYRKELKSAGYDVLAITNGGFFKKTEGSNLPWGMQIINGEVLQEPSTASPAYSDNWFGVTTDGKYVISNTEGYNSTYKGTIRYGIGGGKLLIKNGVAQSVSGEDSYRTCVGITNTGDLILMCMEACSYNMAIFAFQELAENLGVDITTVLNMDGGGSTTMYTNNVRWGWDFDISGEDGWTPRKVADAIAIVAG